MSLANISEIAHVATAARHLTSTPNDGGDDTKFHRVEVNGDIRKGRWGKIGNVILDGMNCRVWSCWDRRRINRIMFRVTDARMFLQGALMLAPRYPMGGKTILSFTIVNLTSDDQAQLKRCFLAKTITTYRSIVGWISEHNYKFHQDPVEEKEWGGDVYICWVVKKAEPETVRLEVDIRHHLVQPTRYAQIS